MGPNTRLERCQVLPNQASRGRCTRKRSGFYGVQLQGIAPAAGLPVAYPLPAGSASDGTGRRPLAPDLPEGSGLSPDAGDTDDAPEAVFADATGCPPHTARKRHSTRPHALARPFRIQPLRHGLETCLRGLTDRFPKKIHATAAGCALHIGRFGFVQAIDRFGL